MKSSWKNKLLLIFAVLIVISMTSSVTANTELTAINPPNPDVPNLIGITYDWIGSLIIQVSSSETYALQPAYKQETLSILNDIQSRYPNLSLTDVNFIRGTAAELNSEYKTEIIASQLIHDSTVSPLWGGSESGDSVVSGTHNDISREAARSMGVSSSYAEIVARYALEPDEGIIPLLPSIGHFLPTGATGYAETYANEAKELLEQGNYNSGYRKLAHSLHFIQDLSVPFHTVAYQNFLNHALYENYVGDNWNSGIGYKATTFSDTYYYSVADVSDCAQNLGNYINSYVDTIDNIMLTDSAWQSNSQLISITNDCLKQALRYSRGVVQYTI